MRESERGAIGGREMPVLLGGGVKGRILAAVCATLLLVALVVPVAAGAESPSEEAQEDGPTLVQEGVMSLPAGEELSHAFATAEGEEAARAQWLEGEEALEQRQASLTAYLELSGPEAANLLVNSFSAQLQQLEADPARVVSEVEIDEPLGEYGAVVAAPGGGNAILESPVPVESELGGGANAPVSLELEEVQGGFAPENPLSKVQLPGTANGAIQLESGVAVDLPGSGNQEAEMLGTKNLFYPETQTTTDTLAAPISRGVEVFEQLRSPESPEQFQFDLNLPEGATLKPSAEGGAEVVSAGGRPLEEIPPASAVDAQGSVVPVTSAVEGDSLLITVAHRAGDFAYPVLLDPRYNEGYESPPFSGWSPVKNYGEYTLSQDPSHLAAISKGSFVNYPANTWGQFEYTAPGETAYIEQATFSNIYYLPHGCQTAQPHGYLGIFNVFSNSYNKLWTFSGGESFSPGFSTGYVGGAGTRKAIVGMGTGGSSSSLACAHEIYVGGVTVQENDPENPTVNSVNGIPSGWFDPAKSGNVTIVATDPGFGINLLAIFNEGAIASEDHVGCTGMANSRCPRERKWTIAPPYKDGERTLKVTAEDPTGKTGKWTTTTKVDSTLPEIDLSGQLAHVTEEEGTEESENQEASESQLSLPVYNLSIKATDGNEASPTEAQSGVKNIEIYFDGAKQNVPWTEQSCAPHTSSCKMEKTYQLKLVGKEAGEHKFTVKAIDQVGHVREREILFEYIPATGIKDEYIMQRFPLSGAGSEEGGSGPELAVNVINGNLVYHQQDVNVSGPNVDLEVERFYNSQLPKAASSEWGSGWTLSQTPELEPESGGEKASLVGESGALTRAVRLPAESGGDRFDSKLHALVTKEAGGDYAITDQSGHTENTLVFDSSGKLTEERTPGPATVDYRYESGKLAHIDIDDPSLAGSPVQAAAEAEDEEHLATPSYRSSFGAAGTGSGQFKHPADVTVDSQGNLWVVDKENNRVEKFNEAGEFLLAAGTLGSGAGQLKSPSGVAMDSFGNVDVTDTANNRVVRFNEKGEFVSAVGANVNKTKVEAGGTLAEKNSCTAASKNVCQAGTAGSAEGLMSEPIGIVTTSGGNFLVVERANGRVEKFNTSGELLAKFGTSTTEGHQLKEPTAIASSPAGNGYFWVADTGNNRIEEWTSSFAFVRAVGKAGSANGEFKHPDAIEADGEGNVYVIDQGNGRVQQLSPSGEFLSRFGSSGSGATQFELSDPAGLAVDGKGNIWLADTGNNRVERWLVPFNPIYASQFGTTGSGNGQFKHPADVAVDSQSNIWAVDKENNRIEKFNAAGEFLLAAGTLGSGAGQLKSPSGIALDSFGTLDVTDTANNRVVRFNEKGEFVSAVGANVNKTRVEAGGTLAEKNRCTAASGNVCQAGTAGSGEGLMSEPIGITTSGGGNFFVVEKANNRVEKFNTNGELLTKFGSTGSEPGQLKEPTAIASAPNGSGFLWVADTGNNRIEEWSSSYSFVRVVGKEGTGKGEFKHPDAIEADGEGNVYVIDQGNGRVQQLSPSGEFLSRFGSSGSGTGQLSLSDPEGLTVESKGNIWIADGGNNRIERWLARSTSPLVEAPPAEPEPAVAVQTSSGLVASVEGEAAGKYTYQHTGERLTAVAGPAGETKYQYDAIGRLTKVELPNGNWATIAYRDDMRVESVSVSIAGTTKKTSFSYTDQPRETVVTPEKELATHYSIGEDGSILKWWNGNTLPELEPMMGSLWVQRGEVHPEPITIGDQNLLVRAHSSEGIESIRIVANGTKIVAEKTCEEAMCINLQKELVTNTANWPPGILQLEAVVTGRLQEVVTQRLWDNIPYTPPPDPEEEEPPIFENVQKFREEFGLDLDLKGNEQAINERIFTLIGDWHDSSTPAGQVARSSGQRWGVPLRASDVAELEYREWYLQENASRIVSWAADNAPTTYGGYRVDNRQGGIIYVGFTANQAATVESLKASGVPVGNERIKADPVTPTYSLESLVGIAEAIGLEAPQSSTIVEGSITNNQIEVGALNVGAAQSWIASRFGSAPVAIHETSNWYPMSSTTPHYWSRKGPLYGGQAVGYYKIVNGGPGTFRCSLGFGAAENAGSKPNGETIVREFALTAGHCFTKDQQAGRWNGHGHPEGEWDDPHPTIIGTTKRISIDTPVDYYSTDVEALSLEGGYESPREVLRGRNVPPLRITDVASAVKGMPVCSSGSSSEVVRHGEITGTHWVFLYKEEGPNGGGIYFPKNWEPQAQMLTEGGDSGAPVWQCGTGRAIGLISAYNLHGNLTGITPLLPPEAPNQAELEIKTAPFKRDQAPGALHAPEMGDIHLTFAK